MALPVRIVACDFTFFGIYPDPAFEDGAPGVDVVEEILEFRRKVKALDDYPRSDVFREGERHYPRAGHSRHRCVDFVAVAIGKGHRIAVRPAFLGSLVHPHPPAFILYPHLTAALGHKRY